ncbi:hypothetical protein DFR58_105110 [Anaerobacterium chartisolvens]|uniref:Alkylation response protein AidB-like acyl-CoA dehydrogenase n=1 Tax=Anaerobacterium chartisolvens TaxID=1297424 RepID=A0A369BCP2_9FIRM|nr:acyl-CoA dehydrogenase family protein [Anaerobacterium chartisolvens]RCX18346.1 hypothetical protein DFR58_105110 [Anaerobacterium chartisolvens]
MELYSLDLTEIQGNNQIAFRAFVDSEIVPLAAAFDQNEYISFDIINKMVEKGFWGAELPREYGGRGFDMISYGLFNEEIGRGCANIRNLVGVQGMVSSAILKWGSDEQKNNWLPRMASGEITAAFALTEPDIGSDVKSMKTSVMQDNSEYIINGSKKWITFGQSANLYLVFAQCDGKVGAFLVERDTPGFSTKPIKGLLGFRGSMLAELNFDECRIPKENIVGRLGFGLSHVANYGLTHGRYSTAWGCVGLAQGCLDACVKYASERKQFDTYLKEHQLIQQMIADMMTNVTAARLLCLHAAYLREAGDQRSIMETSLAKYFASTIASKAASDAVQIHGANGCSAKYPVARYMRDAKIMEIVEGSTQIQQVLIARHAFSKRRQSMPKQAERS